MSFIVENWIWLLAAVVSGGLLLWPRLKGGADGVSPNEAVQLINREKAVIIDVCDPKEFAAAHVVGAKNIPLGEIAAGKGLPGNKSQPVVVVCASGIRSAKACSQLKGMGYERAVSLMGGLSAWREANLPIEKSA